MKNFHYIYNLLSKKNKFKLIFLLVLSVIVSLFELFSIGAILPFVDLVVQSSQENETRQFYGISYNLKTVSIFLVVITIFSSLAKMLLLYSMNLISHNIGSVLASKIVKKIFSVDYKTLIKFKETELTTSVWQRTNEIVYQTVLPGISLISALIIVGVNFSFFLIIEPQLTIAILSILIIIYSIIFKFVKAKLSFHGERISRLNATLLALLNELFGRYRHLTLREQTINFHNKYVDVDRSVRVSRANVQIIGGFPRITIEAAFIIILASFGIYFSENETFLNSYMPFIAALAFGMQKLLPQVQQIYQSKVALQSGDHSLSEIKKFLDVYETKKIYRKAPENNDVLIKINKTAFNHDDQTNFNIQNLNLDIIRGQKICISGKSGSGKSTILDLLLGFLQPQSGVIKNVDFRKPGNRVTIVTQNYYLKNGTIKDNLINNSQKNLTDDQLWEILDVVCLKDLVMNLPNQLSYQIINNANNFSGGQRQRLGLAISLIEEFDMLVLDEATNQLDNILEANVFFNILKTYSSKTIVFVTHSDKIKKLADKVINVEKFNY